MGGVLGAVVYSAIPHIPHLLKGVGYLTGPPAVPARAVLTHPAAMRSFKTLYPAVNKLTWAGKIHLRQCAAHHTITRKNWLALHRVTELVEECGIRSDQRVLVRLQLKWQGYEILDIRETFSGELGRIVGLSDNAILNLPALPLGPAPVDLSTSLVDICLNGTATVFTQCI